jgi:hypothetical protein
MFRRALPTALAVAVAAVTHAACGGGNSSSAPAAPTTSANVARVFDKYGGQMAIDINSACNPSPPSPCADQMTQVYLFQDSILEMLNGFPDDPVKNQVVDLLTTSQGRASAYGQQDCYDSTKVSADSALEKSCTDLVRETQTAYKKAHDIMAAA